MVIIRMREHTAVSTLTKGLSQLFLRGVNLNYRSRAVAKRLVWAIFFGMLFQNVFYRKMMNCFREDTYIEKIVIVRARLVPVPNCVSDFRIPKTLRKGCMLPFSLNESEIT